jgi:hypothetical protein
MSDALKMTKLIVILITGMLIASSNLSPVSGHVGDSLTAWTSTPPTIDGMISPADEWDGAAQVSVFTGSYEGSVFYVMNDANNLYLALKVVDPTFHESDKMDVRFDNDHNAFLSHLDDHVRSTTTEFLDLHYHFQVGSWGILDSHIDGSGAAGTVDGTNFFEISHPLDSGDSYDFSLSAGDVVGFCLSYFNDGLVTSASNYPPNSRLKIYEQWLYGDIIIASPIAATIDVKPETLVLKGRAPWITAYIELPSDYDVMDIDVASLELSCDVTGGSNIYTAGVVLTAPSRVGDYDGDGVPDLMVMFDRLGLIQYLQASRPDPDGKFYDLPITITGRVSETTFEGTDTIRVQS